MRVAIITCCTILLMVSGVHGQFNKKMNADDYTELTTQSIQQKNYTAAIRYAKSGLANRSGDVDLLFLLGKAYMLRGNADSARPVLRRVVVNQPKYRDAYLLIINLEMQDKHPEEALCFADDALYYFPYDREFMLKKMAALDAGHDRKSADKWADGLYDRYYNDSSILRFYINYKLENARRYLKNGNIPRAHYNYDKVLEEDPVNKEAIDALYSLELRKSNKQAALDLTNRMLGTDPRSYTYLLQKVSLLEEMKRYAEALETLQIMQHYFPNTPKLQQLQQSLQMASGRFYMKQDPYLQFQSILSQSPANREAIDYTINLATSKGLYTDALAFENNALRHYPGDLNLLLKKEGTLESLHHYIQAATVAEDIFNRQSTIANKDRLVELTLQAGRQYQQDMNTDSALAAFKRVLTLEPNNLAALQYSANLLVARRQFKPALVLLDQAISSQPGNRDEWLFKKADILAQSGQVDDALAIAWQLVQRNPGNSAYNNFLVDQALTLGRQYMQSEDYDGAREAFRTALASDISNMDALNGMINLESAVHRYDSALYYANRALLVQPDDKNLLLKKAGVLESMQSFREAYVITSALYKRYPFSSKLRNTYLEQVLASGRYFNKMQQTDSALSEFSKVLALSPADSNALMYTINILNEKKAYDTALTLIDRGREHYPESEYFLLKKAVVLENKASYLDAFKAADSTAKLFPSLKNREYADYLRSRTFKNQVGMQFLYSVLDTGSQTSRANIATLQYLHYLSKGSIAARLNFAGRNTGTGLQMELESYYKHNPRYYSYANIGISNNIVFPQWKLGYSLFHNFAKGWEAELGARYLWFKQDQSGIFSIVGSGAKYFGDFWANLRYFLISSGNSSLYHAATLNIRQYLNDKTDYLSAAFGIGNSPDEFSRNFRLPANLGITTYSIGMGYAHTMQYRNTVSISGNWYNQQLTSGTFRNQYDIFFSFLRKF
ncbi:MAG: tetratricopeptide repeat protein [Sediminibacterium magnilacihabitans]|jgi:YaiO family outer membrane protein|nr:tetratricopeptide repeat protein [Sediminibacterium magnilacihabitans]PQV61738.1 YaiO family outer membrane protein [Sediminibacterium magnilacihabitans]